MFPLHHPVGAGCSCGQASCTSVGKHPRTRHGLEDGTTDPEVVRAWWSRWPEANIGARTGDAFDVLDVDHHDVLAAARWPDTLVMPGGPVVRTGGGWHFYLQPTGRGNRARFSGEPKAPEPLDWRGAGGYVILPPSLHASGIRYVWHAPAELDLQPAPAELLAMLDGKANRTPESKPAPSTAPKPTFSGRPDLPPGRWSAAGLLGRLAVAVEGERNTVLNWAANKIGVDVRDGRTDSDSALGALAQLSEVALRIGLGEREIDATIRSGFTKGLAA